jgi:glc operon protein GlcG
MVNAGAIRLSPNGPGNLSCFVVQEPTFIRLEAILKRAIQLSVLAFATSAVLAVPFTGSNAYADGAVPATSAATTVEGETISSATSMKLLENAIGMARSHGLALSFAIVDPAGHLVAAVRMDGAPFASLDFARGKAYASVALGGQSGATLEQRFKDNPSEYTNMGGAGYYAPFLPARGALPIFIGGKLAGALGASGAPSDIDEDAVKSAIESIGASVTR